MRRREFYWSLYHKPQKNQLDDLRTDQVEAVYNAVPANRHSEYLIWKEGFTSWQGFTDFPKLLVSLRKAPVERLEVPSPEQPPTAEPRVVRPKQQVIDAEPSRSGHFADIEKGEVTQEFALDNTSARKAKASGKTFTGVPGNSDLRVQENATPEDRGNGRYSKDFPVRIIAGKKIFENSTVDIAVNGIKLKKNLPSGLPKYFNLELKTPERMIPLVCSAVKESDGSVKNRVKIEVNDHVNILRTLLLKK